MANEDFFVPFVPLCGSLRVEGAGDEFDFDGDVVADESWVVLAAVVDAEVAAVQDGACGVADTRLVCRRIFERAGDGEW